MPGQQTLRERVVSLTAHSILPAALQPCGSSGTEAPLACHIAGLVHLYGLFQPSTGDSIALLLPRRAGLQNTATRSRRSCLVGRDLMSRAFRAPVAITDPGAPANIRVVFRIELQPVLAATSARPGGCRRPDFPVDSGRRRVHDKQRGSHSLTAPVVTGLSVDITLPSPQLSGAFGRSLDASAGEPADGSDVGLDRCQLVRPELLVAAARINSALLPQSPGGSRLQFLRSQL